MNLSTFSSLSIELSEMGRTKKLKSLLLKNLIGNWENSYQELTSYDLVQVVVDEEGNPICRRQNKDDVEAYMIFTSEFLSARTLRSYSLGEVQNKSFDSGKKLNIRTMMLGELIQRLSHLAGKELPAVKVNPILTTLTEGLEPYYVAEEVLFAPLFDTFTKKYLLCDPEMARALLAINTDDIERFGIELAFYVLTDWNLPEEIEARETYLKERLDEIAFIVPRVPMKKGSGTFLSILLNLDNEFEELAFIRDYKTFDNYSDAIFVTSTLKLMSGTLDEIHYNGDSIDTIFGPLVSWQKRSNSSK